LNAQDEEKERGTMGGSRIKGPILQAAIQLFGKLGFEGVTTRELARAAHCMEGGIYRIYGRKRHLYDDAITAVVQATNTSMAAFVLGLYSETGATMGPEDVIKAAVHRWYSSLSQDGAKLLQQILLNDKQHKHQAQQSFANVLAILQKTLESDSKDTRKRFDSKTRTESLISTLFQLKLSYVGPADKEKQEVDHYLQDWLLTVPASDKVRTSTSRGGEVPDQPRSAQR
jgi:AcrR family transcriptional regulator